jgi:hypothetical protein
MQINKTIDSGIHNIPGEKTKTKQNNSLSSSENDIVREPCVTMSVIYVFYLVLKKVLFRCSTQNLR